MAFAKIFETPDHGQVLVKKDTNNKGCPEIRWFVEPPEFGVCSMAVSFEDSDSGWDSADKAFDKSDQNAAIVAANRIFEGVGL
jgi:hypothetical protein